MNLKAYGEFDTRDRPAGWNARLTLSISATVPLQPRTQANSDGVQVSACPLHVDGLNRSRGGRRASA